ncbi:hypothetical protein J4417_04055 [Candidatus Woesearchaeota archaeon]|nr:hypothetical protein [Candidatus Woesearchaeota archaeon]
MAEEIYEIIFQVMKKEEQARLKSQIAKDRREIYVDLETLTAHGSPVKIDARSVGEFYTAVLVRIPSPANCFCRIKGPSHPSRYDFIVQFYRYQG